MNIETLLGVEPLFPSLLWTKLQHSSTIEDNNQFDCDVRCESRVRLVLKINVRMLQDAASSMCVKSMYMIIGSF